MRRCGQDAGRGNCKSPSMIVISVYDIYGT